MYAVQPGKNVPCLIYVTLTENEIKPSKILVYHDIKLASVANPPSLLTVLQPLLQTHEALLMREGLTGETAKATTQNLLAKLKSQRLPGHPTPRPAVHA
jgi:hypothetical protein